MARGTRSEQSPEKKSASPKKAAPPRKKAAVSKNGSSAKQAAAPAKKAVASAKKAPASAKKAPAKKAAAPAKKAASPARKAASSTKAPVPARKTAPAKAVAGAKKTAAPAKKPAPKKVRSPFSAKFLKAQEQLLVEHRAMYMRQYESLRAEAESLVADFESGDVQFDEESGEGDTINIERERDIALSEQARAAVEEIDHALAKLPLGTYGICEVSGDPIPEERLDAIPWARERVEYKTGGFTRR